MSGDRSVTECDPVLHDEAMWALWILGGLAVWLGVATGVAVLFGSMIRLADRREGLGAEVGHAEELAQTAVDEGWAAVVAVGGDGVVHEVANGLMRRAGDGPTIPLGIIAVGSGNDFIKMLGLSAHKPAEAVRQIVEAEPRPGRELQSAVSQSFLTTLGREAAEQNNEVAPAEGRAP